MNAVCRRLTEYWPIGQKKMPGKEKHFWTEADTKYLVQAGPRCDSEAEWLSVAATLKRTSLACKVKLNNLKKAARKAGVASQQTRRPDRPGNPASTPSPVNGSSSKCQTPKTGSRYPKRQRAGTEGAEQTNRDSREHSSDDGGVTFFTKYRGLHVGPADISILGCLFDRCGKNFAPHKVINKVRASKVSLEADLQDMEVGDQHDSVTWEIKFATHLITAYEREAKIRGAPV